MNTKLLHTLDTDLDLAAEILKNGGLVAMPTETVYGLAANALNTQAVVNIFKAKGRAQDNPLIVHIAKFEDLPRYVRDIPPAAQKLADAFWPGPLTMIFQKQPVIPAQVTCGMETVAVRMPAHPVALQLIQKSGCPLAAPSANLSGGVSPTSATACMQDLNGKIDAVVDGGSCRVGLESTIVLMTSTPPRLLRPGFITKEQIENVIGPINVDPAVLKPLAKGVKPTSPGMKYKHYAPKAKVVLIDGESQKYIDYVNQHTGDNVFALCFSEEQNALLKPSLSYGAEHDGKTQAALLFQSLREFDRLGAKLVLAHMPSAEGIGLAVLNRLLRAAAFEVIHL